MSADMNEADLTRLVVDFEKAAYDLASSVGGRVVKTLGDGVMFTADDTAVAVGLALTLTDLGGSLPPIRAGVAWGPGLVREGDCFGRTVNFVSRIVGVAGPGQVLIDAAAAAELADDARVQLAPLGARQLKSFGQVDLWTVTRSVPSAHRVVR